MIASNLWEIGVLQRFLNEHDLLQTQPRPLPVGVIRIFVRPQDLQARRIIEQYARSSLDSLKLWPPKSYFFSPSGDCLIAYAVANKMAICLGDPVGPRAEIEITARNFLKVCKEQGWGVAFYRTCPDFLAVYKGLQLRKLKIGDDAIVDIAEFSLAGRSKRDIRSKARHFEELGIQVVEYAPPLTADTVAQLRYVEDQWLKIRGRRERTFTVGYFDPDYLQSTPVLAAIDRDENVLAFINLISCNPNEIAGDLMRRGKEVPNGITDYLLLKLIQYGNERGYSRVGLGLAPMTGFKPGERATLEERIVNSLLRKLNFLFHFRGLYRYKAKFATSWEPRYLVYENRWDLPRVALALLHLSEIKTKQTEVA